MEKLSSTRAKRAFELFAKKKLDAADVQLQFKPYFSDDVLIDTRSTICSVACGITYHDGKGFCTPLMALCKNTSRNHAGLFKRSVKYYGSSYARLIRWMEKEAKSKNASFYIDDILVFDEHDNIESMLINLDLEDSK